MMARYRTGGRRRGERVEELCLPLARGKAIVGDNAFATAAGLHQAAVIRNPLTYEFLEPATFGAERRMVVSRHSGRHALTAKLEALGLSPTRSVVERIYKEVTKSDEPVCSDNKLRLLAIECAAGRTFADAASLAGHTNGADLAPTGWIRLRRPFEISRLLGRIEGHDRDRVCIWAVELIGAIDTFRYYRAGVTRML